MGFINPALYANPQVMNDVTNGNNPGCGTKGFTAVQGWDPLTGLGYVAFSPPADRPIQVVSRLVR